MPDAVALAMVEALPATAPTVGWQTVGALTDRTSGAAVSTDGTRIYVSHGFWSNGGSVTVATRTVDPSGAVGQGPGAPVGRQGVAGAWCNGKHYAIGGLNSSGNALPTVEAYTPAGANGVSGVWSTMAEVPAVAGYRSAAVIGNFIYVAGGQSALSSYVPYSTFYRYDTTNNTWVNLSSMPAARTRGAMVAVGTKLYYLGGFTSAGAGSSDVYVFDTTAGTWTTGASLSQTFPGTSATAVNGIIYLTLQDKGFAYDPAKGTTTNLGTFPTPHSSYAGTVAIGLTVYSVSGDGTANVDKLDLGAGAGYTAAVLGVKSLLDPILAGVASGLPNTPPTDTAGKATYAANVQTLKALAAL